MDCRDTAHLLCWYLERKLSPSVAREVEQHLNRCSDCRLVLEAATKMLDKHFGTGKAAHAHGRIEKRLPSSVPVCLASLEEPRASERTLTENISPHGARVISKRSWQSGEESLVTPLTGEFPQVGRVIYCLQRTGDRFSVGVEFPDRTVKWGEHSRA
jgi:hypothetical protein